MEEVSVKTLYRDPKQFLERKVTVSGWVRSVRASKTVGFLMLSDGTFFEQLQVVYEQCLENFVQISRLNVGAAVVVTGIVTAAPNA